jgi:hypothetical protein
MKRLIVTSSSGSSLTRSELIDADAAIMFPFRFVGGPLPSLDELARYVAARSERHGPGEHWSNFVGLWRHGSKARRDLALFEFCKPYEIIELWFDPAPDDQLQLICWLDWFRSYPEIAARLKLRLVAFNAFPLLRPALLDLIQELPSSITGLGATEMRLLELVSTGFMGTNMLFYLRGFRQRGVFSDMEIGSLLEGLAHGPRPALAGLDDELRGIAKENHRDRTTAFRRSRLTVTEFGKAVLSHEEDFSRHNPIDRWWGGTHLTNDRLWRWSPMLMKP